MPSYRGLKVIKSKSFSLDEGSQPRDLLRRRVRTAEFYLVPRFNDVNRVLLYDEASDNWAPVTKEDICRHALRPDDLLENANADRTNDGQAQTALLLRPNIEHYMLALIIGRGGLEHLGATFWGQTEMSVFDDGQHGVWGMTYKCKFFFSAGLACLFVCSNVCDCNVLTFAHAFDRPRARDRDQRAQHAPRLGRGVRRLQRRQRYEYARLE